MPWPAVQDRPLPKTPFPGRELTGPSQGPRGTRRPNPARLVTKTHPLEDISQTLDDMHHGDLARGVLHF